MPDAETPVSHLTTRQRALYAAVIKMASRLDERMLIAPVLAARLACSEADVKAVRGALWPHEPVEPSGRARPPGPTR